ncbi:MAG: hypothetical protein Q8O61_12495, partial [Nocardioides sp.]|nr:hypothetical protein [Nocardioides sp.]
MISRSGLQRALVGLAAALLLTACETGGASPADELSESPAPSLPPATATAPAPATPQGQVYVALGDSFVAAPLVPTTNMRNGCLRSDHNYPHLVAAELDGYELVDVSCSGASTPEMTQPRVAGGIQH